jgi:SRSO17 transposase
VAVTVTLANEAVSVPAACQLYLPESWAQDRKRRRAAGVPATVAFRPKWQIALAQIRALHAEGAPVAPVVADAAYGVVLEFRDALTAQQLPSPMCSASARTLSCGLRGTLRTPRGVVTAAAGRRPDCRARPASTRSGSRPWRAACPLRCGPP